ncbi:MAG TPA: HAD family phosphatase [Gemmataceae bacterium]|jgi:putative hydrolase of the HAD superfamily|nr:HAD family phosphatase [Gemmataceae bacterium]
MIRTILFDFGNVVAFFDHDRAIRRLRAHTDKTAEQLWELVYQDDLAYRYERGHATTDDLFAVARDKGGITCTKHEFVAAFCDIFWSNPPVADLIPRLKRAGYRLVLASNTNEAHYAHFRQQFKDVLDHFDAISLSHEAGARKPEPAFFAYTHGLAKCEPGECLFVDDLEANIAAARAFGWHAIHLTHFDDLTKGLRAAGVHVD